MQTTNTILSQSELSLLEQAVVNFQKIVTFDEMASLLVGEKRDVIRQKIALLVKRGWLVRLKKGQYIVVTAISGLGTNELSEYVIAKTFVKDSYVSFENALQYHGLFDQMLSTVNSVTTRYARSHLVGQTKYNYSRTQDRLYFGFTTENFGTYISQVAEVEKALLDILYLRHSAYDVNLVLEKLREFHHRIDVKKLKLYAQSYNTRIVRVVGFLLDLVGDDTDDILGQVKTRGSSYNKMTSTSTIFNAKWRLYYDKNALI